MKRQPFELSPGLSSEVRALLERERSLPALPATTRARAVARARAALAAGPAARATASPPPRRIRWAAAAALVCLASAAAAATAYQLGVRAKPAPGPAALPPVQALTLPSPIAAPSAAPPAPAIQTIATPPSKADAAREELRLLRQARAAVARGDFAAALPPLAEHARRFRGGSLAEEREALRVRALAGLERRGEARRVAAAFEARFPRSVLLPAVAQMVAGPR